MNDCVFCRIISGEIPAERVYEDDKMIVIRDAAPAAPVHVLMIPKEHTENIVAADPELVKYMLGKVKMLSEKLRRKRKRTSALLLTPATKADKPCTICISIFWAVKCSAGLRAD